MKACVKRLNSGSGLSGSGAAWQAAESREQAFRPPGRHKRKAALPGGRSISARTEKYAPMGAQQGINKT